jgi:tetratricopeptide (TPR) repeat protein
VQVMDWGLSKVLPSRGGADDEHAGMFRTHDTVKASGGTDWDAPRLSRPGSAMGTPAYMAPEQARGELERVDERADVFALGSILVEILTGEPAFLGRSSSDVLRKAGLGDTAGALARLDICGADHELVAIGQDCLAREAGDRPRHAGAVAGRVTAYLAGVQERLRAAEVARAAETARAEEAIGRARAERRARRLQGGMAASLLVLFTAGGLTFSYLEQQRQRRDARFSQILAEATALRDRAAREPSDPDLWRDALAALERAEGHGPADRVTALRREIESGLDAARGVATLRRALVDIRANEQDVGDVGTDSAYALAFRAAELDLDALGPAEFARRLGRQPGAVVIELSAFLDDWANVRRRAERRLEAWRRPLEAARLADPDRYRDRLREVLLAEKLQPMAGELKALATVRDAAELPAPSAALLGATLARLDQTEAAVALLRPAAGRFPGDVWVNYELARSVTRLRPEAREEAVRYYTAARAVRPETAHSLAHLLEEMGRGADAEAVYRDLVTRRPEYSEHLECLGLYLKGIGRAAEAAPFLDRAVAAARATVWRQPGDADAHRMLGRALSASNRASEAIAEYREAIRLKPDHAMAHFNLGYDLRYLGREQEAIPEFRETIRLIPDYAAPHRELAKILRAQRKLDQAVAEFREALRLKPDHPDARQLLAEALRAQGKSGEAVAILREATRLQPDAAAPHYNLGEALRGQGRGEEAIAEYRAAIRFKPDDPWTRTRLGEALNGQGRHQEAASEFREAVRLAPYDGVNCFNLAYVMQRQGHADLAIELLTRAVQWDFEYNDHVGSAIWTLAGAYRDLGRYDEALASFRRVAKLPGVRSDDLRLAEDEIALTGAYRRSHAARAAARTGCGPDTNKPGLDAVARAKLRAEALDWFKSELGQLSSAQESSRVDDKAKLTRVLEFWKSTADLAGVRDAAPLSKLPDAERGAWRSLWATIDALLPPRTKKGDKSN